MTNVRIAKEERRPVIFRGRALLFLSGAVLGVSLATACHLAEAKLRRHVNQSVPSVASSPQRDAPKPSRERTANVVRQSRDSVCLIEVTFIFRERMTGEALRRKEWFLTGKDDVLEQSFSGTGFLVSSDGAIVTNRHVAQPWSSDPEAQLIMSRGYRPVLTRLIAYFPGQSKQVRLRVGRVATHDDAAIVVAHPDPAFPPPLPFAADDDSEPGERVSLIGYPAGVRAIVARNRVNLDRANPTLSTLSEEQISRTLAARHAIEPFASVGYVSNCEANVLTLSALVTDGSSGSPVLNEDGQVIGVVRASLTDVDTATLAVPAGAVRQLLGDFRGRE
jgi:serine protease Do